VVYVGGKESRYSGREGQRGEGRGTKIEREDDTWSGGDKEGREGKRGREGNKWMEREKEGERERVKEGGYRRIFKH